MEKMTIHRALSELKLIGAKIHKLTEEVMPSGIMQAGKLVNNNTVKEDFEKSAVSKYQSVVDLITRRNRIKSAIVKANGDTKLKVAGDEMTIADAINLKAVIVFQRALIDTTRKKHNQVKGALEKNNSIVDANALKLAEAALQKQNVKIGDDDVQKVIGPYLEVNKFFLVDPVGIEKKNDEMETKIMNFEAEVDAALSEINAVTFIEF